jgi:hypothetical protein
VSEGTSHSNTESRKKIGVRECDNNVDPTEGAVGCSLSSTCRRVIRDPLVPGCKDVDDVSLRMGRFPIRPVRRTLDTSYPRIEYAANCRTVFSDGEIHP